MAKLVEVGYYEPLGTWTIKLSQLENVYEGDFIIESDEWRVRNYSTSLVLILANGTEIGRATLEFTAPFVRIVDYSVDLDSALD